MKVTINTPPPIQPPETYLLECSKTEAGYLYVLMARGMAYMHENPLDQRICRWANKVLKGLDAGGFPTAITVRDDPEPE